MDPIMILETQLQTLLGCPEDLRCLSQAGAHNNHALYRLLGT